MSNNRHIHAELSDHSRVVHRTDDDTWFLEFPRLSGKEHRELGLEGAIGLVNNMGASWLFLNQPDGAEFDAGLTEATIKNRLNPVPVPEPVPGPRITSAYSLYE